MRYVFLAMLFAVGCDLPGQSARADEKKETYTEAVARNSALLSGFSETIGNQTSELEGIKNELAAVKVEVKKLRDLLEVVDVEPRVVPRAIDAPPVEKAGQVLTFSGKPIEDSYGK